MKKTLVALAALAATASFAQSTVTISGAIASALNSQSVTTGAGASTSTLGMFNNPTGTSNFTLSGVEDLGGGTKGLFLYELDFTSGLNNAVGLSGEIFVGLSGSFGTIKLGTPNQPSLGAQASRNPFGTKTGGGFGGVQGTSKVRAANSIVYSSANFSGFSVGLMYAPEVLAASVAPAFNTAGAPPVAATGASNPLTNTLVEGAAQIDLGLNYANGPLAAGLSYNTQDNTTTAPGRRQSNYYVQYAFGNARVYFGGHNEDALAAATGVATNNTGNNIGIKYTMNNIDLMANWAVRRNAAPTGDQRIWGLGADYNLSKRTAVVARLNQADNDGVAAAATAQTRNVMLGLIHKF